MKERLLLLFGILLVSALSVCGQEGTGPVNTHADDRKRLAEILKLPTFIQLRLLSMPRDVPREKSTETPAPYKVKDWIGFRLLASQSAFEEIPVPVFRWPYTETRPMLMRDGDIVPYSKQAEAAAQRSEELFGPGHELKLRSGVEHELQDIRLEDWYEPLSPGRYELTVRRRFDWQGDWLTSAPIYFEVQPRTSTPIPAGVSIELTPEGLQPKKDGTYEATSKVVVVIFVVNKSDQTLKLNVIDREYGNRPQLFRDGVLVPYREEVAQRIRAKEENPRLVEIVNDLFVEPKTRSWFQGISLEDWYGPLPPGSYRLTDRQRFEIDGSWTAESAPLLFEIRRAKSN